MVMSKKTWISNKNSVQKTYDVTDKSVCTMPIYLTNNKTCALTIPSDITLSDVKLLNHAMKNILLRIELDKI